VPSGLGFSWDRALAMAVERFGFTAICLGVIVAIVRKK